MQEPQEEPQAIEVIPPLKTKFYETQGDVITIFRLRLMSAEQIEAHGLEKYATHLKNDTHR